MEELKEFYFNPRTGLISAEKIFKKLNKKISLAVIKDFIKKQESYQIMKPKMNKVIYKSINVYSINNQWQIDLIDLSKYSKWNSGFKFLLCSVDVYSRKAYVVAMKSKTDTAEGISQVFSIEKPILIQSDNGTEFLNKVFQNLLKINNVRHITVNVGDHNRQGIVERFNKTIEGLISRYQESRNTNRYIDVLEDLVYNYNNSYHRGIEDIPQKMHHTNPNKGFIKYHVYFTDIKKGDSVRILLEKTTFSKGYEPKFSKSIYTVTSGNGYTFQLKSEEGVPIRIKYKYFQLQKISELLTFQPPAVNRQRPMTRKERSNKREITSLEEFTQPPLNKKRRH